ncbi:hypothetical protein ACH4FA_18775 [Streptomyces sp. NPDC017966]|uniref:hypothetical protein n=1 Tax=Streptomyces sp. NPDC017966 TaxID=3365023 RepID=UPI0037AE1CDC
MPLLNEPEAAGPVERILQSDHDDHEILLIVDRSDYHIAVARRLAEVHPDRVGLLLTSGFATKAGALNFTISATISSWVCRG